MNISSVTFCGHAVKRICEITAWEDTKLRRKIIYTEENLEAIHLLVIVYCGSYSN